MLSHTLWQPMSEFDGVVFARVVLAASFLIAGIQHARRRRSFAMHVFQYRVLPARLTGFYTAAVPPLEIAGGLGMLLDVASRPSAVGLGVLILSFLIAVLINLARGRRIPCGCFGEEESIGPGTLLRLGGLLALVAAVVLDPGQSNGFLHEGLASALTAVFVVLAAYLWRHRGLIRASLRREHPEHQSSHPTRAPLDVLQ